MQLWPGPQSTSRSQGSPTSERTITQLPIVQAKPSAQSWCVSHSGCDGDGGASQATTVTEMSDPKRHAATKRDKRSTLATNDLSSRRINFVPLVAPV
jgi:hypothetical protein